MTIYSGSIELNPSGIDFYVITYQWFDGQDFDTRTRVISPTTSSYVGWGQNDDALAIDGGFVLRWAGDFLGTSGKESILFDAKRFAFGYPTATSARIELRGQWFSSVGSTPIRLTVVSYVGGAMVVVGDSLNVNNPIRWANPTADDVLTNYATTTRTVSTFSQNPNSVGQFMTNLTINLATNVVSYS